MTESGTVPDLMEIREATNADEMAIWEIFKRVIAPGDTYVFEPNSSIEVFRQHWMKYVPIVAVEHGQVVGTHIIKPNQMGLGAHVANGSYMVDPDCQGRGIGKALGLHSIEWARSKGFRAIQFNLVVATNEAAVALWKKIGFRIIGTVPRAFNHRELGFVDGYIMYQSL